MILDLVALGLDVATVVRAFTALRGPAQNPPNVGFTLAAPLGDPGNLNCFASAGEPTTMRLDQRIELRFAGQVLRPRAGEERLIPAGEPHTVINTGNTRNHWYYGYKRS